VVNNVSIIGNLTQDPVVKNIKVGGEDRSLCELRIAVNRTFKADSKADYFDVTVWNGLGAKCAEYLHKGSKIAVSNGQLRLQQWEAQDGTKRSRVFIEVSSNGTVQFLTPPRTSNDAVGAVEDAPPVEVPAEMLAEQKTDPAPVADAPAVQTQIETPAAPAPAPVPF
jgi:single-strand DNA-binding protein